MLQAGCPAGCPSSGVRELLFCGHGSRHAGQPRPSYVSARPGSLAHMEGAPSGVRISWQQVPSSSCSFSRSPPCSCPECRCSEVREGKAPRRSAQLGRRLPRLRWGVQSCGSQERGQLIVRSLAELECRASDRPSGSEGSQAACFGADQYARLVSVIP